MDASPAPPSAATEPASPAPLLPSFLLKPSALLWLWVLPIGVMLLLNLQGYWLVSGNMDETEQSNAVTLGIAGGINLIAGFFFYFLGRRFATRATAPLFWFSVHALPAIAAQVAYLWAALTLGDEILPTSVTGWIYTFDRYLFTQFTFAMLPLFLGILRLAGGRPPRETGEAVAINFGYAIGAPILFYLLSMVVFSGTTWRPFLSVVVASVFVLLGVLMFFGIVRLILVGLRATVQWGAFGERIAIVLCALVLPVCGLLLNRSIPFPVDFQAWEVYALVAANTAILLLASWKHQHLPRTSFGLLCATFPFSLYFFAVFLPYTPLSIFAVIAIGAGFLVLTPTFLFTLHLYLMHKSCGFIPKPAQRRHLVLIGLTSGLVLPGFFVARGFADKTALHAALDYVYTPALTDSDSTYPGSETNLKRALANHRNYKDGIYYPFLSDFYAWLVFDNLVLPDDKLAHLEKTFFGESGPTTDLNPWGGSRGIFGFGNVRDRTRMPRANPPPRNVEVTNLEIRTQEPVAGNTTVTIELTLENKDLGSAVADEYLVKLPLPVGVFVNGFRLHINGDPVPGRIFEKKTALWVYTMIRDMDRRDPGVLVYNRSDELELKVYPVMRGTPTTVEIDFLLPGAPAAEILSNETNDPALALSVLGKFQTPNLLWDEHGTFLAGGLESGFPGVERDPAVYVIVDRSIGNGFSGDLGPMLNRVRERFPQASSLSVTLANYDIRHISEGDGEAGNADQLNEADLDALLPLAGSLNLDRVLADLIRIHQISHLDSANPAKNPAAAAVAVLIGDKAHPRTLDLKVADAWMDLVPELEIHEFGADGKFITHRTSEVRATPLFRLGSSVRPLALGYAVRFATTMNDARLEFWSPQSSEWLAVPDPTTMDGESPWAEAARLQMSSQDYTRSPGNSGTTLPILVKSSRETGILLPATSYIVVESEAQWRMLESAEAQKLGQNEALDFLETPAPPALFVAIGFALWLLVRQLRRRQFLDSSIR